MPEKSLNSSSGRENAPVSTIVSLVVIGDYVIYTSLPLHAVVSVQHRKSRTFTFPKKADTIFFLIEFQALLLTSLLALIARVTDGS